MDNKALSVTTILNAYAYFSPKKTLYVVIIQTKFNVVFMQMWDNRHSVLENNSQSLAISNQIQYLTEQNSFYLDIFTVHFQW